MEYAKNALQNGGVFVDSGANIGQWLLYLAHQEGVKTFAFEPVSSQRDWLEACLKVQHDWDVKVIEYGLAAKREHLKIQCDGPRSTLNTNWYQDKKLPTETIEVARLDQILSEYTVSEVTFWKLDVEGAELGALQGAEAFLKNKSIKNIYFECHPDNYSAVTNFLKGYGYKISYLQSNGELRLMQSNCLTQTQDLIATIG